VKCGKTVDLPVIWVDAPESVIEDEGGELAKQERPGCVKITMSEVDTESIF